MLVLAGLLAACSGGGGSGPASSSSNSSSRTAMLTIVIPPASSQSSSSARRVQYISPSTQTIVITAIYGTASPGPGESVDVSPGSPNCTPTSGGTRTCDVSVAVQTGATALDVAALDANKALLAHALVTLPAVSDPVIDITVTLGGDAKSVVLSLLGGEFTAGIIGTKILDITALDADGNTIQLPGAFDIPILLTPSDPSITIDPMTIVNPGDTATITYNGNPLATTVITASVNGATSSTGVVRVVGSGPPATPIPPPSMSPTPVPSPTPSGATPSPGPSGTPSPGIGIIIINGHERR